MKLSIRESNIKEAREHKDPYVVFKAKDGKFWVGRKSDTTNIHRKEMIYFGHGLRMNFQ